MELLGRIYGVHTPTPHLLQPLLGTHATTCDGIWGDLGTVKVRRDLNVNFGQLSG